MPALQGHAARNHRTEPKPPRHRTGSASPPCLRSQHRKGRTDLSRREEEAQAEFGSGTCSSCAPAFPRAFNTQTNASPSPMRPPPRCRPPCSNRHSPVPPSADGVRTPCPCTHLRSTAGCRAGNRRSRPRAGERWPGSRSSAGRRARSARRGCRRGRRSAGRQPRPCWRGGARGRRQWVQGTQRPPQEGRVPVPSEAEGSGEAMLEHRVHLR